MHSVEHYRFLLYSFICESSYKFVFNVSIVGIKWWQSGKLLLGYFEGVEQFLIFLSYIKDNSSACTFLLVIGCMVLKILNQGHLD